MPKSYDAVTKRLIDLHPEDWLALLGIPNAEAEPIDVEIVDSDLSTVSGQADRVLKINGMEPGLQHIELETGHHGADSPKNLLRYSVLVSAKYNLPVESAIVLLRPEADSPALTGSLQFHRRNRSGSPYLSFEYTVIRVWQLSVESVLSGGLGTLPLAPIANVTPDQIPAVVRRMQDRMSAESATAEEEAELWTSANVLLGMRFSQQQVSELLKGVRRMKESTTYQAIVEEGRVEGRVEGRAEEARSIIIRLGSKRFSEPSSATWSMIAGVDSLERLDYLVDRILAVESWDELLGVTGT